MNNLVAVIIALVASGLLYVFVDKYLERKSNIQKMMDEYNGIKDDPNTDDLFPW